MVHPIFRPEKRASRLDTEFSHPPDIAARAKTPAILMLDDHRLDFGLRPPIEQRGADRLAHAKRQCIDGARAVERDPPGMALGTNKDVFGHRLPALKPWLSFSGENVPGRSEERRVGKECVIKFRSGWSP